MQTRLTYKNKAQDMKISIIGAGAMGGAMAEGFAKSGVYSPADITTSAPHESTLSPYKAMGLNTTTDNIEAAKSADVVCIVVKPWMAEQVIKEIKGALDYQKQTVVAVVAGITSDQLKSWLDKGDGSLPPLFIVMPNIAIAVGCSMSYIVPINATSQDVETVAGIFNSAGSTLVIEERLLGQSIAMSCSIAYAMRYVRASTEGSVQLGFKAKDALKAVLQTVKGAVELLQHDGNHPEQDIDKVTTPGGFTIRGLNEMEHAGFTSAVIRGLTVK